MKSLLKILLAIAGVMVALALALAIAVALLFDPKDYQPLLEKSVEESTGRKLTLAGDLGLRLFPCCSVTLGRSSLGNPPGFPAGEFASVEGAALSLKVWQLITKREVGIGAVRLDGLNANLLVRADGAANWEFESTKGPGETTAAGGAETGKLVIEGIEVRKGQVAYRDERGGSSYLAEDIELRTNDITPGKPFDLKLSAKLTDRAGGTAGTVALKSRATLDAAGSQLTLEKPAVDLTAAGKAIPAKSLTLKLGAAELAIEFEQDTKLRFRKLQGEFKLPGLKSAGGDVEGSFTTGDASLETGASSELILPQFTADLTLSGKDIPGASISAKLEGSGFALDLDKMRGGIQKLSADINGLGARLALAGGGRIADKGADLAGTLKLDSVSPRNLLAVLKKPEPQTADPKALTRLAGTANWALAKDSLRLQKLDVRLDDTRMTGSLGVANFDKPATSFDLALDAMDLDRYLAPKAEGGAGSGTSAAASGDDIPVETIRGLRLDGRLQVGQLTFAKAKMAGVGATLRAADGRLRLDPLVAKLYGGEYRGAVAIDATGPAARLTMDQQVAAVQVGGILKDLYQNEKLTGALSGHIVAAGTGNRNGEIVKSLAGNVALNLADGVYQGTDVWHEIRSARARLKGDAPPPAPASPQTRINAMEFGGNISDGVLTTDRLLAEIPFIRMTGTRGALNLVDKTMDFHLQAKVFETPTFEDGTTLKDLTGLAIPLTLKGPMDKPKAGVDLKELATGVATEKLREKLLKKLGVEEQPADGASTGATSGPAQPATAPPKEEKPRDALKRALQDLLKPKQ